MGHMGSARWVIARHIGLHEVNGREVYGALRGGCCEMGLCEVDTS